MSHVIQLIHVRMRKYSCHVYTCIYTYIHVCIRIYMYVYVHTCTYIPYYNSPGIFTLCIAIVRGAITELTTCLHAYTCKCTSIQHNLIIQVRCTHTVEKYDILKLKKDIISNFSCLIYNRNRSPQVLWG